MIPVLEMTFSHIAGDPWKGRATVRFQGEPSGPLPVREGMTSKQRADVRWYIEKYMDLPEGGNATRAAALEKQLAAYGHALWDGLTSPVVSQWLGAVQAAGEGRLELLAATLRDEGAFRTPWELIRVGGGDGQDGRLLHQLGVSIVRRVKADLPRLHSPDTKYGLRVLTLVARPTNAGFLDTRYTPEAILTALESRPEVTVDFARPGTLTALVDALEVARQEKRPFHVVHFDGHGTTLPQEAGIGALCFEKDDGSMDLVRAPEFGDLMSGFNIPPIVLEACRTATKSFAQDTVAGALLRKGVGTVLGMGHAVHVDITRELMAAFYEGLARGWPLGVALKHARNRVYANPHRRMRIAADAPTVQVRDWFVPQLYQGDIDPTLLEKKSRRRKARPTPPMIGFPPAPRAGFQGRGFQLHRLERLMLGRPPVVIHAPGGMGKTALVREAAHWWTRTGLFPDGAVFVSLEGLASPDRVIASVGEALEGVDFHKRENPRAWIEDRLARRRMLIVWDNYESVLPAFNSGRPAPPEFAELARAWTSGGSRLLITCRDAEVGFDARPFPLDELSTPEGLMLLVGFLEEAFQFDRATREHRGWTADDLEPIVKRSGGHPLALELLASQIPTLGPKRVLDEFSELLARIEQKSPEGRNRSMWASLDLSIRHLSDETRAALSSVALLSGGCLENMAAMVVGLEGDSWGRVRTELERTGPIRVEGPFFRPHPVLGDLVGQASPGAGTNEDASPTLEITPEADERFIRIVASFAAEFGKLVRTLDSRVALGAMAGTEVVVRRAIDRALASGQMEPAWIMACSLRAFLQLTGRGGEGAALMMRLDEKLGSAEGEISQPAADVEMESAWARAATDPQSALDDLKTLLDRLSRVRGWDTRSQRAMTLGTLGRVYCNVQRRPAEAIEPLEQAVELFAELEADGEAGTANRAARMGDLANAYTYLGRFDEALQAAEDVMELDRQRNDHSVAARDEGRIAQILAEQGRHGAAEERYRAALAAAEQAGDDELAAIVWQSLGILANTRKRPDEAVEPLTKALAAIQRARNEESQIMVLNSLGEVERHRGNREAALSWYQRSLELAERLQYVEGQAAARGNRTIVLSEQAQAAAEPEARRSLLSQAIAEGHESLALTQQFGKPASIAIRHTTLANHLRLAGQFDEAQQHAQQALAIREQLNSHEIWKTLSILEQIAAARGDTAAAAEYRRRKEAAHAGSDPARGGCRSRRSSACCGWP